MSPDPSVSRSFDAVTPSVSADPVAEVLARVLGEHEEIPVFGCTCTSESDDGTKDVLLSDFPEHAAEVAADALREAGLIPEVKRREPNYGVSINGHETDEYWDEQICEDPLGEAKAHEEWCQKFVEAEDVTRVVRCTRTKYADHVTEWEAVE